MEVEVLAKMKHQSRSQELLVELIMTLGLIENGSSQYSDSDFLVIPHQGPITYWYPCPFAERTGAGTPSGDIGLTAPRVVRKIEKPQAMKPWQHGLPSLAAAWTAELHTP